jgi:hypothetical protein
MGLPAPGQVLPMAGQHGKPGPSYCCMVQPHIAAVLPLLALLPVQLPLLLPLLQQLQLLLLRRWQLLLLLQASSTFMAATAATLHR